MPQSIPASTSTAEAAGAEAARLKSARLRAVLRPWLTVEGRIRDWFVLTVFIGLLPCSRRFSVPFDPNRQNLLMALTPPQYFDGPHFLGTDQRRPRHPEPHHLRRAHIPAHRGRVWSSSPGSSVSFWGWFSGYFGGWVDFAIQKLLEVFWAFLAAASGHHHRRVLRPGAGGADRRARDTAMDSLLAGVARANTLSLKEHEFVMAARSLGAGHTRIVARQ